MREATQGSRWTNVVESPFAAVRLRTSAAKRFRKVDGATALIWKLLMVAEKRFRKLNSPHLLPGVLAGKRYARYPYPSANPVICIPRIPSQTSHNEEKRLYYE